MNETARTVAFVCIAGLLVGIAVATTPSRTEVETFKEEGLPLFPDFTDSNAATSIEITAWDPKSAAAKAFKVELRNNRWVIPSHSDYPAEAEKRLEDTAAHIRNLRKDIVRSEQESDHAAMGVVDPLDEKATLEGRGKRVVLKDITGLVLADFIVGGRDQAAAERGGNDEKKGWYFVRLPGKVRTYSVKMEGDVSESFHDWIEPDLLKVETHTLKKIEIDRYHVDERQGAVVPEELVVLNKPEWQWTLEGIGEKEEVDQGRLNEITEGLDTLKIVDVRRKPEWIGPGLTKLQDKELTSDQEKILAAELGRYGFFIVNPGGRLISNQGEVRFWTEKGVKYTLRFGELALGEGEAEEERRYLFLTVEFDAAFLPEPVKAETETDDDFKRKKDEWQKKVEEGQKTAKELAERYGDWYYVIPGDVFKKVYRGRAEVVGPKAEQKP